VSVSADVSHTVATAALVPDVDADSEKGRVPREAKLKRELTPAGCSEVPWLSYEGSVRSLVPLSLAVRVKNARQSQLVFDSTNWSQESHFFDGCYCCSNQMESHTLRVPLTIPQHR
jgi:hypothetical protein